MRNFPWFMAGLGAIILVGLHSESVSAQATPAQPMTLWNYLGIPQGVNKIQDATFNRLGNNPNAERTPPLTRIADPANLNPNMPQSIQAAAKIKQQEDLAPQKIKAIKYLATVGCGCYQKMGVREALLESLDDCTEEVRYEAALAFVKVAGNCCEKCGTTCCNAKVMNKLKELADGTDERCCPKEPSERVREAAREALNACKNKLPAMDVTPGAIEQPKHKVEGLESPAPLAPSPDLLIPPPPSTAPTPAPTPSKKPVNLPGGASTGDPLPGSRPVPKVAYVPPAIAVVQTSASAAREAPIRLRLVIDGERSNTPGYSEASISGSQHLLIPPPPSTAPTPAPTPSKKPVNLLEGASTGDPLPGSRPVPRVAYVPPAIAVVQTSASAAPEAPIRLRLVIGGERSNTPGYSEASISGSQQ